MKKKKVEDENYIDFGQWLYELRQKRGITEDQLAYEINMTNVQEINIKKWERDLDFPDLDAIYKLSEIYMIPSAEIIDKKQKTLAKGVAGIHFYIIRWISLLMGISIYGTIWVSRVILTVTFIGAWVWFYFITLPFRK